jgi:ribonuclease HII
MTAAQRQRCAGLIRDRAVAFGLAAIAPPRIDRIDILRATLAAHRRALGALGARPQVVFVDGRYTPPAPPGWDDVRFEALIGGDGRSLAVAAASILAKVARDRAMVRLDRRYPEYGFARHKGYATAEHRAALRRHGLSPQHRRSFCGWLEAEAAAARQGTLAFAQPS